jgi:hypothetical protein
VWRGINWLRSGLQCRQTVKGRVKGSRFHDNRKEEVQQFASESPDNELAALRVCNVYIYKLVRMATHYSYHGLHIDRRPGFV